MIAPFLFIIYLAAPAAPIRTSAQDVPTTPPAPEIPGRNSPCTPVDTSDIAIIAQQARDKDRKNGGQPSTPDEPAAADGALAEPRADDAAHEDDPSSPACAARLLAAQQRVFQAALRKIEPCIVRIDTIGGALPVQSTGDEGDERRTVSGFRQADGPTTGVIWSADGEIVTSTFNFARDPVVITVTLSDRRTFIARLVARDRTAGVALLKIDAKELPVPRLARREELRPGMWSIVAGYGLGGETPAVFAGIISALDRVSALALQTDAKTSPANYGGPVFDADGRLLGVCVPFGVGEDELAGANMYDSGIGFAALADLLAERIPRLRTGRDLERGRLGVVLDNRDPAVPSKPVTAAPKETGPREGPNGGDGRNGDNQNDDGQSGDEAEGAQPPAVKSRPTHGLSVTGEPRGPAAEAGMKRGDIITHLDGRPIERLLDLRRIIARKTVGDAISVTYWRDGAPKTVTLHLASPAAFAQSPTSQPR